MELKTTKLALTVYKDDTLKDVERVVEADRLKIPYRVSLYIGQSLDTLDLNNVDAVFKFITGNLDKLDKVIKATFGLSDAELDCVDTSELVTVGVELYKWGIDKIKSMRGADSKNAVTAAE